MKKLAITALVLLPVTGCMTAEQAMLQEKKTIAKDHQTCEATVAKVDSSQYDWCRVTLFQKREQPRQRVAAALTAFGEGMQREAEAQALQNAAWASRRQSCMITGNMVNCW